MEIAITQSTNRNKKLDATINGAKKISFGDSNYSDFRNIKVIKEKMHM